MKIYMSIPISFTEKYYAPYNYIKNENNSIKQLCFLILDEKLILTKNVQFITARISSVNFKKYSIFGLILQKIV